MSLYGYKEMLDNRVATLVVAADTVEQYVEWCDVVKGQENGNFNEIYTSNFLDGLQNPIYKGYKHPVVAFYHNDETQRDAFWVEWDIQEVKSATGLDRHLDMLHKKKVEVEQTTMTEEEKNRTIEQRFGLDQNDPWDRRSEEEKEEDRKMKERMKELVKKGEISGDSFGGAEAQRSSRSGPKRNFGRTETIEGLKDLAQASGTPEDQIPDYDNMTNEELFEELAKTGVVPDANVGGVFDDDAIPPEVTPNGDVHVTDIKATHNADGTFEIDSIRAVKVGGEIDTEAKEAAEAAHAEQVAEKKGGKRVFSPEDFAAVLRGDGSADAVTHVTGDDRKRREATERPSLSDHAENARKEYQEEQAREMKRRGEQARKEADLKAKGERDRGIFRGSDLMGDDEITFDELPEKLRAELDNETLKRESYPVKDYPYNSELGGRALLPFDGVMTPNRIQVLGGVNIEVEGTVSMGEPAVMVVSKNVKDEEAWAVYGRARRVETDGSVENKIDVWLVRIR